MPKSLTTSEAQTKADQLEISDLDKRRLKNGRLRSRSRSSSFDQEKPQMVRKPVHTDPDNCLFSLDKLLDYIEKVEKGARSYDSELEDPRLPSMLSGSVALDYSKYLKIAQTPEQLADIYAEMDINDYNAELHGFTEVNCEDCGGKLYPEIRGDTYNPYMKFKSKQTTSSKTAKKLRNLIKDYTMLQVVPTFPEEISQKLPEDPAVKDEMWKALKLFLDKLEKQKTDEGKTMGSSASLHTWSSKRPTKPHGHFHTDIPMLQCKYPTKKRLMFFVQDNKRLVQKYHNEEEEEKKQEYANKLNDLLASFLGVERIPWVETDGGRRPVDHDEIKDLWTDCVNEVFGTYYDRLNVNLQYYGSWEKAKMLHDLTYRSRSPVVDIALSLTEQKEYDLLDNQQAIEQNKEWIKDLIDYDNTTRVFGFWTALKQLIKYGVRDEEEVCRLCGGDLMFNGCTEQSVKVSEIDKLTKRSGKNIQIFDAEDPPPVEKSQKLLKNEDFG